MLDTTFRGLPLAALIVSCLAVAPAPDAHALGLEQVLAEVAAADPMLEAQAGMTRAARARATRAGAWDAPMLDLMAENVPITGGLDQDAMTMRVVGIEQRLDVFGARGLARRAAGRDAGAAAANAEAVRYERLAMAWEAYASAWSAAERARAAREHRGVMDRMVAAGRARYESGRGRLDDLLRAEAERARLIADATRFEAEERGARARLDALRGREPGAAPEPLEPPSGRLVADADAAWAGLAASHPRVRAAAEREAARRASVQAMRRMGWPELTLRASFGFRAEGAHGEVQENMWSAGVGVMLPIGNESRQGAEAAEMAAMAEAAAAERRAESLAIAAELEALRARARADERAASLLADTVLVAQRRALAASWSAYETGTTDLAGVLDAAHASYAEELSAARAREGLALTLARLLALGARPSLVGVSLPGAPAPDGSPGGSTPRRNP
jgi:outer membrane protein TolC